MIHIITGTINSGKSTTINTTFHNKKKGDGFISVKVMSNSKVHGYDIVKLSDKTTQLFVIRDEFYTDNKPVSCQIGPYLFLQETLDYIQTEIRTMIRQKVTPIYLDEIGQLELYNQCFHSIFREIIESNIECYITVREDLVDAVIRKYNLKEVTIKKI
jgi:nucleoside-triphosphatase THEP1